VEQSYKWPGALWEADSASCLCLLFLAGNSAWPWLKPTGEEGEQLGEAMVGKHFADSCASPL
jgi:hypothetical protein